MVGPLYLAFGRWLGPRLSPRSICPFKSGFKNEPLEIGGSKRACRNSSRGRQRCSPQIHRSQLARHLCELRFVELSCCRPVARDGRISKTRQAAIFILLRFYQLWPVSHSCADFQPVQRRCLEIFFLSCRIQVWNVPSEATDSVHSRDRSGLLVAHYL